MRYRRRRRRRDDYSMQIVENLQMRKNSSLEKVKNDRGIGECLFFRFSSHGRSRSRLLIIRQTTKVNLFD